ncbi:MAG: PhzF family phenazine biosynthesis protein [candidate division Zixibacteria bacterium]|nr:PhzF family phenazine biosynthesis protein [candidate division Zixibacteria bacterium]
MNRTITLFQVDSFTDVAFKGNPAGVCITDKALDDKVMQNIALEMNLSETAFAVPANYGSVSSSSKFSLRWFTPSCEVDLCGHATLAAAKILYNIYNIKAETIKFDSKSGELLVSKHDDLIQLDFPIGDPQPIELPGYFRAALRLSDADWANSFTQASQCKKLGMLLICFKSADMIKNISPNFTDLANAELAFGNRGVIITAEEKKDYDFISRFFAPGFGINEDPVTGAAHTVLAPYWSAKLNKSKMRAYQVSQRGGVVLMQMQDDRVLLSGKAVIVLEGVIHL